MASWWETIAEQARDVTQSGLSSVQQATRQIQDAALAQHRKFLEEKERYTADSPAPVAVEDRLPWEKLRDDEEGRVAAREMEHIIGTLSQDENACVGTPQLLHMLRRMCELTHYGERKNTRSVSRDSFLDNAAPESFSFDLKEHVGLAKRLLEWDQGLGTVRYRLVPRQLTEEEFWRNYFYRISLVEDTYRAHLAPADEPRRTFSPSASPAGRPGESSSVSAGAEASSGPMPVAGAATSRGGAGASDAASGSGRPDDDFMHHPEPQHDQLGDDEFEAALASAMREEEAGLGGSAAAPSHARGIDASSDRDDTSETRGPNEGKGDNGGGRDSEEEEEEEEDDEDNAEGMEELEEEVARELATFSWDGEGNEASAPTRDVRGGEDGQEDWDELADLEAVLQEDLEE